MAGNITNELVGKLGMKNLSKGVKVDVTEEHVSVDLSLNIRYGYNIPAVSEQVQEKVSSAIENMTGLTVLGCKHQDRWREYGRKLKAFTKSLRAAGLEGLLSCRAFCTFFVVFMHRLWYNHR